MPTNSSPVLSDDLVAQARTLSSATLHEAAGKIGALPSRLRPIALGQRLCGRAFPIACPPGDNLFLHHAIYAASPGDVLVADTGGGAEFGYWGEIMATAAQVRGLAGLVITGGVRDSARMARMGFPVFSETICIQGTGKNPRAAGSVGEPIRIGSCPVEAGDLVFGDDDGVIVLPAAAAADVIGKSQTRDADEAVILDRLRAGETTLSIYGFPALDPAPPRPVSWRRSVEVPGLSHGHLPIPAASRVGGVLATGGVRGVDRATGELPPDVEAQARLMFENLRAIVEAGGATCDDIVKLTLWVTAHEARAAINPPWSTMFPDPARRPARHILTAPLGGGMLVQCEAIAIARTS